MGRWDVGSRRVSEGGGDVGVCLRRRGTLGVRGARGVSDAERTPIHANERPGRPRGAHAAVPVLSASRRTRPRIGRGSAAPCRLPRKNPRTASRSRSPAAAVRARQTTRTRPAVPSGPYARISQQHGGWVAAPARSLCARQQRARRINFDSLGRRRRQTSVVKLKMKKKLYCWKIQQRLWRAHLEKSRDSSEIYFQFISGFSNPARPQLPTPTPPEPPGPPAAAAAPQTAPPEHTQATSSGTTPCETRPRRASYAWRQKAPWAGSSRSPSAAA